LFTPLALAVVLAMLASYVLSRTLVPGDGARADPASGHRVQRGALAQRRGVHALLPGRAAAPRRRSHLLVDLSPLSRSADRARLHPRRLAAALQPAVRARAPARRRRVARGRDRGALLRRRDRGAGGPPAHDR